MLANNVQSSWAHVDLPRISSLETWLLLENQWTVHSKKSSNLSRNTTVLHRQRQSNVLSFTPVLRKTGNQSLNLLQSSVALWALQVWWHPRWYAERPPGVWCEGHATTTSPASRTGSNLQKSFWAGTIYWSRRAGCKGHSKTADFTATNTQNGIKGAHQATTYTQLLQIRRTSRTRIVSFQGQWVSLVP